MRCFTQDFAGFFKKLKKNNNREWFKKNKDKFLNYVKIPFENFVGEMIYLIHRENDEIQITPHDAIFRIYRDVRFSKDKKPYKTYMAAIISAAGRSDFKVPGFYFELGAEGIQIYGGAYFLDKDQLQKMREYIVGNSEKFYKIIGSKNFKNKFGKILGEKGKRIPGEFKELLATHPYLDNKQFYYHVKLDTSYITSPQLTRIMLNYFRAGKPLNSFLNDALKS